MREATKIGRNIDAEEHEKAIDAFIHAIDELTPVKSKVSSTEAIRLLRQGRNHELSDQLKM